MFQHVEMRGHNFRINILLFFAFLVSVVSFNGIYLDEKFTSSEDFKRDWTVSKSKISVTDDTLKYQGVWEIAEPKGNIFSGDNGLYANEPSKHYSATKRLKNTFEFSEKPLIVQYEFLFPTHMSCGGGYIKLLSRLDANSDLSQINDTSPYTIMFGPDICGNGKKIHFIIRHLNPVTHVYNEKHLNQPDSKTFDHVFSDGKFHHLLLQVNPDNSYLIQLDGSIFSSGSLLKDFTPPVNPPEFIEDPNDKKPSDWDDRQKIPDPNAVKPEDWDESAPRTIPDLNAKMPEGWLTDAPTQVPDPSETKPEDWDDEIDGEWTPSIIPNPSCSVGCGPWTAPDIPNPKYKGKWVPPLMDNPEYKGEFKPRKIKNPEYFYDDEPFKLTAIDSVAFELWIVTPGVGFDNLLVTDDIIYSKKISSKIISSRANVYRMNKIKDIATSKLTLQILSGIFGGTLFIIFIYYKFLRNTGVSSVKEENSDTKCSDDTKTIEESPEEGICDESSKVE